MMTIIIYRLNGQSVTLKKRYSHLTFPRLCDAFDECGIHTYDFCTIPNRCVKDAHGIHVEIIAIENDFIDKSLLHTDKDGHVYINPYEKYDWACEKISQLFDIHIVYERNRKIIDLPGQK